MPGSRLSSVWDTTTSTVIIQLTQNNRNTPEFWRWDGTMFVSIATSTAPVLFPGPTDYAIAHDPTLGLTFFVPQNMGYTTCSLDSQGQWTALGPVTGNIYADLAFPDAATNRVAIISIANGYWLEWTGSNWVVQANGDYTVIRNTSLATSPSGTLFMGISRAYMADSGQVSQLFLSSYPFPRSRQAMTYDSGRDVFVMHGGVSLFGGQLSDTWELQLGPSASYTTQGAGCPGSRGVPTIAPAGESLPEVGTVFTLQVSNLPFTGVAFMFLGLSNTTYGPTPLPFSLAGLGAPGCSIQVSGDALYVLPNFLGLSTWSFPVPNLPGAVFYNQAFATDPAANVLGISSSNSGTATIGN